MSKHSLLSLFAQPAEVLRGANGAARQAAALRQEGVIVERSSMGEFSVDFATYGWFPVMLPSDEAEIETSDSDDEGQT